MADDVISLLAELVKIPSVCGQEANIARFIADWLQKNGVRGELVEARPNRPNVVAVLDGKEPGPRIMLNGHMDTVDPGGGWSRNPYGAEINGGKMYGRGSYDMKAGLAGIMWAAAKCREEGLPKRGQLVFAAVVDEEAYDWGTYTLVQKGLTKGLDLALVAEATGLDVVTAHFGRAVFEITVHGRATHSMDPAGGVNAIEKAAQLITAFPQVHGRSHPKFGTTTLNTLKIEGGQKDTMLVPDSCRVTVDRCLVPGYSSAQALEDLRSLIGKTGIDAEARLVDRETPFCDPYELADNDPSVGMVMGAAKKALGRAPEISYHAGPCDSCILANQGKVPTIDFGPSGAKLHESDEYVDLESVRLATNVYYELIRTVLS